MPEDSSLDKISKAVIRQSNLYKMMTKNNVCVVSDPYLLALDGLPKFEIIQENFKKKRYITPECAFTSFDRYMRMNRKEMRACLNKLA